MATSMDFISFPPDFDVHAFAEKSSKICVVAVIGKSRFAPFSSKASLLNPIVDKDIFQGFESVIGEDIARGDLECYYDEDTQVLYLHLLSHLDASSLVRHCSEAAKANLQEDFYSYWQEAESRFARMMLLVFSLSHIVVLVHPTSNFDMTYIKFFRILDSIRLKLQPQLTELLRELPVSKEWSATGRLCSPRVLCVFHSPNIGPHVDEDSTSKSRSMKMAPLKRMQHNLEDQIYRVLRRARVITNISNNSLFAVPANQEFVFINSRKNEATEPSTFLLNLMKNHFSGHDTPRNKSSQARKGNNANSSSSSESVRSPPLYARQENSFKEFVWQHVEIAFHKGFDDNVGRNPVTARFELPSASMWFEVCQRMHEFLFDATPEGRAQSALNLLRTLLDPDLRFSESRCSKIISMAEAAYQSDLPPFYVTAYHLSKLAQAKRVFSQYARGPAFDKYLKQLEDSCTSFWTNSRQQCEAISLSGNLCVNQLHRALCETVTDDNQDLPVMAHSSQLKTKAACNCGRQQAEKDDPFDHRSANYDFYMTLEAGCCGTLQHIDMPTFKPSGSLVTAVASPSIPAEVNKVTKEEGAEVKDVLVGMSALSLALSLGQSGGDSDLFHNDHLPDVEIEDSQHEAELSQEGMMHPPVVEEEGKEEEEEEEANRELEVEGDKGEKTEMQGEGETEEGGNRTDSTATESTEGGWTEPESGVSRAGLLARRQHSTTEYLPGMLHTNCPPGLLPKFPSWSLCCLDSAPFYSHQHGLDLPGFLTGSNFLLPWDLPVHAEKDRWPTINETTSKRGRHARRTGQKSVSEPPENTVRVYIGMEYECPRGHRFFCSSPDKVIKVLGNCSVKDTANRLVNSDMPLYTPCHCHTSKGFLAQLMRVYTVTPEGPLRMILQPKIRPAPHPCPLFHPGTGEIELPPGGIWVLRLPHVYMGDNGPINVPSDPQNLHACITLKGMFVYKELTNDG